THPRYTLFPYTTLFRSPNYELNDAQALYSNEDSGVYFAFEFLQQDGDDEEGRDTSLLPVSFNLNYFRPHAFGLEAEPELSAFVRSEEHTSELQSPYDLV